MINRIEQIKSGKIISVLLCYNCDYGYILPEDTKPKISGYAKIKNVDDKWVIVND